MTVRRPGQSIDEQGGSRICLLARDEAIFLQIMADFFPNGIKGSYWNVWISFLDGQILSYINKYVLLNRRDVSSVSNCTGGSRVSMYGVRRHRGCESVSVLSLSPTPDLFSFFCRRGGADEISRVRNDVLPVFFSLKTENHLSLEPSLCIPSTESVSFSQQ